MDDEIKKKQKRKKIIIISIISFVVLVSIIFSIIYYKKKKAAEDALKKGAPTGDLNDRNYKPKPIFNDKGDGNGDGDDKNKGVDIDIDRITNKQNGVDGDIVNVPGDLYGKGKNKTKISSSSLSYTNLSKIFGGEDGNGSGSGSGSGVDIFNPVNDTGGFLGLTSVLDGNIEDLENLNKKISSSTEETIIRLNKLATEVNRGIDEIDDDLKNPDKSLEGDLKKCRTRLDDKFKKKFGIETTEDILNLISSTSTGLSGDELRLKVSTTSDEYKEYKRRLTNQELQLNAFFGDFLNFLQNSNLKNSKGTEVSVKLKNLIDTNGEVNKYLYQIYSENEYKINGSYGIPAEEVLSDIKKSIKDLQGDAYGFNSIGYLKEMGHVTYTGFKFSIRSCKAFLWWDGPCESKVFSIPLDFYYLDALIINKSDIEQYINNLQEVNSCVGEVYKTWEAKKDFYKSGKWEEPPKIKLVNPQDGIRPEQFDTSVIRNTISIVSGLFLAVCDIFGIKTLGTGKDSAPCAAQVANYGKKITDPLDVIDTVKSVALTVSNLDRISLEGLGSYIAIQSLNSVASKTIANIKSRKGPSVNIFTEGDSNVADAKDLLQKTENNQIKILLDKKNQDSSDKGVNKILIKEAQDKNNPDYKVPFPLPFVIQDEICNDGGEREAQKAFWFYRAQIILGTSDYDTKQKKWIPWDGKKKKLPEYKEPVNNVNIDEICAIDLDNSKIKDPFNFTAIEAVKVTFISLGENGYGGPKTKIALANDINSPRTQEKERLRIAKEKIEQEKKETNDKLLASDFNLGEQTCLDKDGNKKEISGTNPNKDYCDKVVVEDTTKTAKFINDSIKTSQEAVYSGLLKLSDKKDTSPACINNPNSSLCKINQFSTKLNNIVEKTSNLTYKDVSNTAQKLYNTSLKTVEDKAKEEAENFARNQADDLNNAINHALYSDPKDPTKFKVKVENLIKNKIVYNGFVVTYYYTGGGDSKAGEFKDLNETEVYKTFYEIEDFNTLAIAIRDLLNKDKGGLDIKDASSTYNGKKIPASGNVRLVDGREYGEKTFLENYKKNLKKIYDGIYFIYNFVFVNENNWKKEYNEILKTSDKNKAISDFKKENYNKNPKSCNYAENFSRIYSFKDKKAAVVYVCTK